jgi:hypothetical protein
MANEQDRQKRLLRQVLSHLDTVLVYPERRSSYPCVDDQHAHFPPTLELQAADNLRVSVGLARLYAAQRLTDNGARTLQADFEDSGFIIRCEDEEEIAIIGQHFVLDKIRPQVQIRKQHQ